MKVRDIYDTVEELKHNIKEYFNNNYCGYMGEWVKGSEEEYNKLRLNLKNYLESDI